MSDYPRDQQDAVELDARHREAARGVFWQGTIGTVHGCDVQVIGQVRDDVKEMVKSLDHEGSTGWEVASFGWRERVEQGVRLLLSGVDADPKREGLRETPQRVTRFWEEMLAPREFEFTTFEGEGMDQMVVQAGIPFYSMCEHHMVPFFGSAAVAYVPAKRLVGLSKLTRAVQEMARGLQNQERITRRVAELVSDKLKPEGVAVQVRARHLCMEMRGARAHGTFTTTSCLLGCFKVDARCREEFLLLAREGMRDV